MSDKESSATAKLIANAERNHHKLNSNHIMPSQVVLAAALACLLLLVSSSPAVAAAASPAARPHIVLMCLDDIGRTDTGIYGKSNVPMPNIVQLAKQGAVLENFYTQTVCSPTRSALMVGRYPFRMGMQHVTTQLPGTLSGVPLSYKMVPQLLRDAGYDTHMIGKWHCGYATWQHTPYFRGFNSYLGYLQAQISYYSHNTVIYGTSGALDGLDFWDNDRPMWESVLTYSLDLYDQRLTNILTTYAGKHATAEQRAAHPLFIYYAHQTVHVPLEPRRDEKERCGHIAHKSRNVYCSMLVELDDSIGSMVQQLKQHELWDNTLVLLLTDNGGMVNFSPKKEDGFPNFPASQGSKFPLRGSKTTLFDGGVRSLGFVSGGYYPKELAGQRFTGLAHVVDFTATILAAAKLFPLKREQLKLDGTDLWPQLLNKGDQRPRTEVPINILAGGREFSAIRFATKYKLIVRDSLSTDKTNPIPVSDEVFLNARNYFDENGDLLEKTSDAFADVLLFDLEQDVQERHDLSKQRPDLVQLGKDLIESYVRGGAYMEPQNTGGEVGASHIRIASLPWLHGGAWKPFMSPREWTKRFAKEARAAGLRGVGGDVYVGGGDVDGDDAPPGYFKVAGLQPVQ